LGLNYVVLVGEALSAPEKKHTLDGHPVASFNISIITATEDNTEAKPASIKITAGKKLADKSIAEIFVGDMIMVEGKLYTKTLENRLGQKQKIPYIQATNIRVIKEKENRTQGNQNESPWSNPDRNDPEDDEIPF
jgi:single-stranded DNA-binding protein